MVVTAGRRELSRGELLLHQLHFHIRFSASATFPKITAAPSSVQAQLSRPTQAAHTAQIQPLNSPGPSPSGNSKQNSSFYSGKQLVNQPHRCKILQVSHRLRSISPERTHLQCSHLWAAALPATPDSFGRDRTSKLHGCSPKNVMRCNYTCWNLACTKTKPNQKKTTTHNNNKKPLQQESQLLGYAGTGGREEDPESSTPDPAITGNHVT